MSSAATVLVRPAVRADAEAVAAMAQRSRPPGRAGASPLSAEIFLRDGFGNNAAFAALVAEADSAPRGYAIYFWGYDPGSATRGVYLAALFVDERWRRRGIGRALVRGLARRTGAEGGRWVFWSVLKNDRRARRFYRALAPELANVAVCAAYGADFDRIAAPDDQGRAA